VQHLESRCLLAAQLSIADAAVNENVANHHISFVISLSEPAAQQVTFNYATQDGTAKSGIDYTAKAGQASLAVGVTSWVLDVDVSPDSLYEKDETFQVVLSNVSGAQLADGTADGTIRNDDAIPIVRIQPSSTVNEPDSGTALSGLVATIEGQSEDPVTFSFTTLDGTAQAGVDYVASSGSRAQESSKPSYPLIVEVNGDTTPENSETFFIALTGVSNAVIDPAASVGMITILDNDTPAVYLSDLTPTSATSGWGPYEKDHSNGETGATDGHTITLNGVTYAKGLGVHSISTLKYALNGQYSRFISDIGVDDEVGTLGSVAFRVYVDGFQKFDSNTMTGTSATQHIDLDVTGAQQLWLEVGDANNGKDYDHADWAGARLVQGTPAPLPTVSISDATVTEGDSGTSLIGFVISSPQSLGSVSNPVSVTFKTRSNTAEDGSDFVGQEFTVLFMGQSSRVVLIEVKGDTVVEPTETFFVDLISASGAAVADPRGVGTIFDNDAQLQDVFLSDLTPTVAQNGWGPYEKDRSNGETGASDGHTITLNGQTYTKGLGVHAASDLRYALNGQYTSFQADIGVDDEAGANGSVIFSVFVDGEKVYDSGVMTGSSATKQVSLDVTGKQDLRLYVSDASNGNTFDHADWANARLTRPMIPATQKYLSDLAPVLATNGWGPYEKDRSNGETGGNDGHPITLNGQVFSKGLGVHAQSELKYQLGGAYTHFFSKVGIDDEVGNNGSVIFQVYNGVTKLFDSGVMTGASATQTIDLDITGVDILRLIVTDAGNGNAFDHADWADAQVTP
jgi:hypothetical protein